MYINEVGGLATQPRSVIDYLTGDLSESIVYRDHLLLFSLFLKIPLFDF